jgi:hypothetical protein
MKELDEIVQILLRILYESMKYSNTFDKKEEEREVPCLT